MKIKKYCVICKVDREIDVLDVLTQGKKRVLCGLCGSVLLTEGEVQNYWWRFNGSDC